MNHVLNCTGHEMKMDNIVRADGVYLFDENGRRYMDLESGVWCISVGHGNRKIIEAAKDQLDSIMHAGFCYTSSVIGKSAGKLLDTCGLEDGKCLFLCSGSEAIEVARQVARHLTGRKVSMTFHDAYLGAYSSATDRSRDWYLFDWSYCRQCKKNDTCDTDCPSLGDIPVEVSDFIFEPGSSSGFVRFPPEPLVRNIVDKVRQNGGRIIVNEVTTGVGRTGRWYGYQHYKLVPDMIALGKGIGNGYPVSAALFSGEVARELIRKPFKYSQSHQNDPLGAAIAGQVVAEITERDLIAEAEKKGFLFLAQLQSLVDGQIVRAVRGRGLMFAIDLVDEGLADKIYNSLIVKGYIIGNRGSTLRIDPPLIVNEAQLSEFINEFRKIITLIKSAGRS